MLRFVIFHVSDKQQGGVPELYGSIVLPPQDNLVPPVIAWEAERADHAIQQAALQIREGGTYYATNYDTLIVADGVELQMQAIVPGIKAAGASDDSNS